MDWFDVVSALSADPAAATDEAHRYHANPYNASLSHYSAVAQRLQAFVQSGQLGPFAGGYWGHPKYLLSPEQNLILASHYLDNLAVQRLSAQATAIFGGKNPHPQSLIVGGITSARDGLDAQRIAQYQFLMQQSMDFVMRAYLPDMEMIGRAYRVEALAGHGGGLGNYMSAGAMNLTEGSYNRRSFLMPQGIVWGKDLSQVDALDAMKIGEEIAHSWYTYTDGATSLHPLQGQTHPAYEGLNADGTLKTAGGYSWVKAPRYDGKPVEVGPLARMMVAYAAGDPKARALMDGYTRKIGVPFSLFHSTVGRTVARALETQLIGESIPALLGGLVNNVKAGDDRFFNRYEAKNGSGFALGKAPRGMLSHWLVVENGSVKNYQAIVPTTWNASPKDGRGVRGAYEAALVGQPMHDPTTPLEVIRTIHSFDPCLACAVHVLNRNGEELSSFEVEV